MGTETPKWVESFTEEELGIIEVAKMFAGMDKRSNLIVKLADTLNQQEETYGQTGTVEKRTS
jgi:hypothetical protein